MINSNLMTLDGGRFDAYRMSDWDRLFDGGTLEAEGRRFKLVEQKTRVEAHADALLAAGADALAVAEARHNGKLGLLGRRGHVDGIGAEVMPDGALVLELPKLASMPEEALRALAGGEGLIVRIGSASFRLELQPDTYQTPRRGDDPPDVAAMDGGRDALAEAERAFNHPNGVRGVQHLDAGPGRGIVQGMARPIR